MASAVPMTLSSASDLIDLSIQKIVQKSTNLSNLNVHETLFNSQKTEDYYEKDSSMSGFSEASRLTEGAQIASESPVQGFDKTYTQEFFGNMAVFTQHEWKFGIKKRRLESVVKDLIGSLQRKRERILTEYLENSIGATTSYTITDAKGNYSKSVVGGDGVALINNGHTREDGGASWNNVVYDGTTYNMDFAPDAIRAMYRTASLIRDPKGNLMDITPDTFVCRKGSSNYFDMMEINGALRRDSAPNSAENNGRPYGAFKVVDLPFMTSTNAAYYWFLDSSMKSDVTGPQYRESQAPMIDAPEKDYKTKSIYVSSTMAFDFGHNDGRNWIGSTGANA